MAEADRIEVQALRGDPAGAVKVFLQLKPNTGNRMHYDLRLGELQVMAGDHSAAMRTVAKVLKDAEKRSDYGRDSPEVGQRFQAAGVASRAGGLRGADGGSVELF
jgi:hypothetical protein